MSVSHSKKNCGFTLVELLVAMAIFTIMIAFLGQLMSNTAGATNTSKGKVSADDQARFALDRIGEDLLRMSKRSDLDYKIEKRAGNDDFYFYGEVPGLGVASATDVDKQSGISLVGYRIGLQNKLERYSESVPWDQLTFLSYDTSNNVIQATTMAQKTMSLDSQKYHVLCDGVFRLEIQFLLRDGTYSYNPFLASGSNLLQVGATDVNARRSESTGGPSICIAKDSSGSPIWRGLGWRDVSAVIITLVVIDDNARKILSDNNVGALVDKFQETSSPDELPMKDWTNVVNSGLGIPVKAASGVRVYQRAIYLNTL